MQDAGRHGVVQWPYNKGRRAEGELRIKVELDPTCAEPEIILRAAALTEETERLLERLSDAETAPLAGFREGAAALLEIADITRFYASGAKVFACTASGEYAVKFRLYELEERLGEKGFVRISHSEIVRLKAVKEFDLSFAGTIRVIFRDGSASYVSRRYVGRIKQVLGI